jgi:hypothetical protein
VVVGLAAAWAVHWRVLDYGFVYDDYAFLRPLSLSEVANAFRGPWDPGGVQVAFYRPLTVLLHKLRFDWFQFDARAYHWLSLVLVGMAGGLIGTWVGRVTREAWAGTLAAVLTVAHPVGVWSMTAWITNQFHALQAVVIAVALNVWWSGRQRGTLAWLPLLALQVVAFLVKEDGLMLLPTLLVLQAIQPGVEWRKRLPPLPVILMTPALLGLLLWWRTQALGGLGGYGGSPTIDGAAVKLAAGLRAVVSAPVEVGPVAWTAVVAVLALLLWKRSETGRRAAFLIVAGAAIVGIWNLPFVLVTKPEQYYALALGASVSLAGAFYGLMALLPRTVLSRAAVALLAAVWLASAVYDDRLLARQYSPGHGYVRETDEVALGWPLPPEFKRFLEAKAEDRRNRRATVPLSEVASTVTYGMYAPEPDGPSTFQWTAGRGIVFVTRRAREFRFKVLAHEVRNSAAGRDLRVEVDGRQVAALTLEPRVWTVVSVPIPQSGLRQFARVDIISPNPWRPSDVDPGSQDTRWLGVRVTDYEVLTSRR